MKRKIKINPYASISKIAWNSSCKDATKLNEICQKFKRMTNDLRSLNIVDKDRYKKNFISIINGTWGDYLNMKAEDYTDCREILYEAKRVKFIVRNMCEEMKEQFRLVNARYS